jgi:hypothetical protein
MGFGGIRMKTKRKSLNKIYLISIILLVISLFILLFQSEITINDNSNFSIRQPTTIDTAKFLNYINPPRVEVLSQEKCLFFMECFNK